MIGQRSRARPIFLLSYLLPLLCVIPTLWEKFCCCSGSLQSMEMNIPVSTPAPQLLFLLSCPKPKAIFYPNRSGTRGPHTSRLLSVVRSWHCLLSRHQPHTSMEVWSSKASSRAPERLWQDLSIFQVTDWSSVEANKISGTPVRSRTMLAGHQEGLQANTNSSHLLSPRLSEDRSNLRSWMMGYRGREKRRARHSDGQPPTSCWNPLKKLDIKDEAIWEITWSNPSSERWECWSPRKIISLCSWWSQGEFSCVPRAPSTFTACLKL